MINRWNHRPPVGTPRSYPPDHRPDALLDVRAHKFSRVRHILNGVMDDHRSDMRIFYVCQAIGYYSPLLNIRPRYRTKIVQSNSHYSGRSVDLELDIAVGYSESLQFEVIQVIRGDANIYTDLIDTRGQGIHHIGFVVSRISERIGHFKRAGFQPIQHGALETKGKALTRFAYFDTIDQFGYITELIQTTLFGFNVGMSRWMMKVGRLMGDVGIIAEK